MPFTIKSRKTIETPLEAEYRKQVAQHIRDNDPLVSKAPTKPLRSFALVDDTVTLSSSPDEGATDQPDSATPALIEDSTQVIKASEPVTPDEKNKLGIFSIHV